MTPALPTAFLVLAQAALTAGGHDPSVPERLSEHAHAVAPVLTAQNLIAHDQDIASIVIERLERTQGRHMTDREINLIMAGVETGVVSGYLLADMLAGREGAQ